MGGTTRLEDLPEEAVVSLDDVVEHVPAHRRDHPIPSVLYGVAGPVRGRVLRILRMYQRQGFGICPRRTCQETSELCE